MGAADICNAAGCLCFRAGPVRSPVEIYVAFNCEFIVNNKFTFLLLLLGCLCKCKSVIHKNIHMCCAVVVFVGVEVELNYYFICLTKVKDLSFIVNSCVQYYCT